MATRDGYGQYGTQTIAEITEDVYRRLADNGKLRRHNAPITRSFTPDPDQGQGVRSLALCG
jgi:hypothetical protein